MANRKTALVTGASRGIGKAIAHELAGKGYELFITGRDEASLKLSSNATVRYLVADLEHADAVDKISRWLKQNCASLTVLVNNAGVALSKPFGTYTLADWERVMIINARAPFFLTQSCIGLLQKAQPGYIINICSVVSKKGYPEQSAYSASKHALLGLTKSIAKEVVKDNIRVHAILPGAVNTEMVRGVRPDIDTGELIAPEEVAQVVGQLVEMDGNAVIDEIEIRRKTKPPWA